MMARVHKILDLICISDWGYTSVQFKVEYVHIQPLQKSEFSKFV